MCELIRTDNDCFVGKPAIGDLEKKQHVYIAIVDKYGVHWWGSLCGQRAFSQHQGKIRDNTALCFACYELAQKKGLAA